MEKQLIQALEEEVAPEAGRMVATELRGEMVSQLEVAGQGAEGLIDWMGDVGEVANEFHINIFHPTAPLHERGGHIEPFYTRALTFAGFDRDMFYEALKDCEEYVDAKRYVRTAILNLRRRR